MSSHYEIKDLVCPFCSLHCDDIKVSIDQDQFKVHNKDLICAKKIEANNIKNKSLMFPLVKGKISTLINALKITKEVISSHNETLLLNHGVELSGLRSILSFASVHNCIIDHVNSKTCLLYTSPSPRDS